MTDDTIHARSTPRQHLRRRRHRFRRAALAVAVSAAASTSVTQAITVPPASAGELPFPWTTGFATAAGGTLGGDARILDGRLRLTDADVNAAGAWAMDDVFPSSLGLDIEFDYAMYTPYERGADGLLLYLADGAVAPGVGAYGAGLGYACRYRETEGDGPCSLDGLPGAFAGVAIDQYGNFSLPINGSGPGRTPDSVAIRGSGNGLTGYRFVDNAVVPGGVATGSAATRTVRVTLQPEDGGLTLTVRMQTAGGMTTVLDRVPIHGDGQAPLPPTLRLGFTGATGSHRSVHEIDDLTVAQPADLRVEHDMPPVIAGDHVRYTVTATNVGRNASDPSALTVDVPDALHDVTWTCAGVDASSTCATAAGSGDVSTALGLPRDGTVTVTVEGTLDPGTTGQIASEATIAAAPGLSDTVPTDNVSRASAPVTAIAQVETGKSVSPDAVAPGDEVEYTVTARNRGPSSAADVGAVDELPGQLAFVGSDDDCAADGQHVTCRSTDSIAPGAERAFRFRARLDPEYRGDGSDILNVATATSPTDPDGGDESPAVPIVVVDPGEGDSDGDPDGGGESDPDGDPDGGGDADEGGGDDSDSDADGSGGGDGGDPDAGGADGSADGGDDGDQGAGADGAAGVDAEGGDSDGGGSGADHGSADSSADGGDPAGGDDADADGSAAGTDGDDDGSADGDGSAGDEDAGADGGDADGGGDVTGGVADDDPDSSADSSADGDQDSSADGGGSAGNADVATDGDADSGGSDTGGGADDDPDGSADSSAEGGDPDSSADGGDSVGNDHVATDGDADGGGSDTGGGADDDPDGSADSSADGARSDSDSGADGDHAGSADTGEPDGSADGGGPVGDDDAGADGGDADGGGGRADGGDDGDDETGADGSADGGGDTDGGDAGGDRDGGGEPADDGDGTARPSSSPAPVSATGGTTPRDGARPGRGALAYTGTSGLAAGVAAAVALVGAGAGLCFARRRRRTTRTQEDTGER
jgi:uncharacterized repeat protein (TIGR01451 family)